MAPGAACAAATVATPIATMICAGVYYGVQVTKMNEKIADTLKAY